MDILAIKYVKAGRIDSATRAKYGLPSKGTIKVVITNPDFQVKYTPVSDVYTDMRSSFKGSDVSKLTKSISSLSV